MTAPTLTEFLLARIAEDEETVRVYWQHARRDAECEARRRIIEAHPIIAAHDVWGREVEGTSCEVCDCEADLMLGGYEWPNTGGCVTLKSLAAIYSDHPDYREEWRP